MSVGSSIVTVRATMALDLFFCFFLEREFLLRVLSLFEILSGLNPPSKTPWEFLVAKIGRGGCASLDWVPNRPLGEIC